MVSVGRSRRFIFDCKSFVAGGGRRREGADLGRTRSATTMACARGASLGRGGRT